MKFLRNDGVSSPAREQTILALSYLALVAVVTAMSLVGASVLARPFYVLCGLAMCAVAAKKSPWLLLTTTMWFWLFTAFVRRIIEWHSGFNPSDLVLAAPNVMVVFFLKDILNSPTILKRRELIPAWAWTGAVCFGMFNSWCRGDIVKGSISAADWLIPVFYYFFLIANLDKVRNLEQHLVTFLAWSQALVVPYAIIQYFLIPDWDATWVIASGLGTIGKPLPMATRIFGTFNNCGFLAIWGGVGIMLATQFRNKSTYILLPLSLLMIILTLVRSVYGSILVAFLVLAVMGKQHLMRSVIVLVLASVCMVGLLAVVSPVVVDHISTRFESMQHLDGDESAHAREALWKETPQMIDENPFGLGIGAIGRGAVDPGKGKGALQNVDSSVLAAYLALGWVAGTIYVFSFAWIMLQNLLLARRSGSPVAMCFSCAALVPLLVAPFVNLVGFSSVSFWLCIGISTALSLAPLEPEGDVFPLHASPLAGAV